VVTAISEPDAGLSEEAKIGLGVGIGTIGLGLISAILGYLTYRVMRRPDGQPINDAIINELRRWRPRFMAN